jgi:hypothetical protein
MGTPAKLADELLCRLPANDLAPRIRQSEHI